MLGDMFASPPGTPAPAGGRPSSSPPRTPRMQTGGSPSGDGSSESQPLSSPSRRAVLEAPVPSGPTSAPSESTLHAMLLETTSRSLDVAQGSTRSTQQLAASTSNACNHVALDKDEPVHMRMLAFSVAQVPAPRAAATAPAPVPAPGIEPRPLPSHAHALAAEHQPRVDQADAVGAALRRGAHRHRRLRFRPAPRTPSVRRARAACRARRRPSASCEPSVRAALCRSSARRLPRPRARRSSPRLLTTDAPARRARQMSAARPTACTRAPMPTATADSTLPR